MEFAAWEAAGGYRLFMSLTRKWLRMHPEGTPPSLPPAGPFMGDAVRLTVSREAAVAATSVVARETFEPDRVAVVPTTLGRSEARSVPTEGTATRPAGVEGGVLILSADRANSVGVVTEILLQPVANARRKPKLKAWKTAGFYAFTDTVRSVEIPVAPGAYAIAYRFVDSATGQETAMAELGAITVGGAA